MNAWWTEHPDLEGVARRGRKELQEDSESAERDTELLRKRRRRAVDLCYEWMSRGDLVTVSVAHHEFEGRLVAAVNDLVVVATKTTDAAMNLELVDFVRSDRKSEFAGSSGDRTAGSFRAALGRAEVEQKLIRVVGESGVFDVTGVIDASTDDHIVMRDPQGHEWLLPRTKAAFAVVGGPTPR
jgi:hypothetical protein